MMVDNGFLGSFLSHQIIQAMDDLMHDSICSMGGYGEIGTPSLEATRGGIHHPKNALKPMKKF